MPSKPMTGDEIYQLPLTPKDDERATDMREQYVQLYRIRRNPLNELMLVLITHTSEGKQDG